MTLRSSFPTTHYKRELLSESLTCTSHKWKKCNIMVLPTCWKFHRSKWMLSLYSKCSQNSPIVRCSNVIRTWLLHIIIMYKIVLIIVRFLSCISGKLDESIGLVMDWFLGQRYFSHCNLQSFRAQEICGYIHWCNVNGRL